MYMVVRSDHSIIQCVGNGNSVIRNGELVVARNILAISGGKWRYEDDDECGLS